MLYLKSKEREKLQMRKQQNLEEALEITMLKIAHLENEAKKLKEELAVYENSSATFAEMSYDRLMSYYVNNSMDWFDYDYKAHKNVCTQPEIYDDWRSAYEVFKNKRIERDTKITQLLKTLVERRFDGQLTLSEDVIYESMLDIQDLYKTITPFDCEDKKWEDESGESWFIRVQKKVHSFLRSEKITLQSDLKKCWVVEFR